MEQEVGYQPAACGYETKHEEYDIISQDVIDTVYKRLANKPNLFLIKITGLWELYLASFPEEARGQYTCHACKDFITRYGGLVTINDDGSVTSALWDQNDVPPLANLALRIEAGGQLTNVVKGMLSPHRSGDLGKPVTGEWTHLSAALPTNYHYSGREYHNTYDFARMMDLAHVYHALDTEYVSALISHGKLLRKEIGIAAQHEWTTTLIAIVKDETLHQWRKTNKLWLHLSKCHPGWLSTNSLLTTLYDDVIEGYTQEAVTNRFNTKADPSAFMRPTTAPAEMNVAEAEKFFVEHGYAASLLRRHATIDDIYHIWREPETEPKASSGSLFGHLATKEEANAEPKIVQGGNISLRHFHEAILPTAIKIEVLVPPQVPFINFTAPADPTAPIITRSKDGVSMYAYQNPIPSGVFGLEPMSWATLSAVTGIPLDKEVWATHPNPFLAIDSPAMFGVLKKAKDTNRGVGMGLFPEDMIRELFPYKRVIEAYSAKGLLDGYEEASAAAVPLPGARIRVTGKGGTVEFTITHIR